MCEIQFVKWAIEIDERSDLPCINLYYTMDYDNKLMQGKSVFSSINAPILSIASVSTNGTELYNNSDFLISRSSFTFPVG